MGWLFFNQDVSSKLGLIWKSVSLGPAGQELSGTTGTMGGVSSGRPLPWDTPLPAAALQTWDSHLAEPSVPCIECGGVFGTLLPFLRKKKHNFMPINSSYCRVEIVCVFTLIDNHHKSEETLMKLNEICLIFKRERWQRQDVAVCVHVRVCACA